MFKFFKKKKKYGPMTEIFMNLSNSQEENDRMRKEYPIFPDIAKTIGYNEDEHKGIDKPEDEHKGIAKPAKDKK